MFDYKFSEFKTWLFAQFADESQKIKAGNYEEW